MLVAPTSTVFTPQELAYKMVALDYGNGIPREALTTCAATVSSGDRLAALLCGEFEATVLQKPWITSPSRRDVAGSRRRHEDQPGRRGAGA